MGRSSDSHYRAVSQFGGLFLGDLTRGGRTVRIALDPGYYRPPFQGFS